MTARKEKKKNKNERRAAAHLPPLSPFGFKTHIGVKPLRPPPFPPPRKLYWLVDVFFCCDSHGPQVLLAEGALGGAEELFAFLSAAPLSF